MGRWGSWKVRSVDDYGHELELLTLSGLYREGVVHRDQWRGLSNSVGRRIVRDRRAIGLLLLIVISFAGFWLLPDLITPLLGPNPVLRGCTAGLILGAYSVVTLGLWMRLLHRIEAEYLAVELLDQGRCAACATELGGCTDMDGRTTCPQCGAVWKLTTT